MGIDNSVSNRYNVLLWAAILFLCNCGGTITLTPHSHQLFFKSEEGEITCLGNNCCLWHNKSISICAKANNINSGSASVVITPGK